MPSPWHLKTEAVLVRKLCVGPYENNVYVVACRNTRQAVIVDASHEPDRLVAETSDVTPVSIITTHGHMDHVTGSHETGERLGIPVHLHAADIDLAGIAPDETLEPGPVTVGEMQLDVAHTPGHTPGSISIVFDGAVLSGDTLFPGGPGATRFPYSSFDQIMESLERELFTLPDETVVMPGHGLDTTIGAERPELDAWRARGW